MKPKYILRKPSKEYCYVPERFDTYDLQILEAYRIRALEALLENPDGIRLPARLGDLRIMRFLPKNTPVNRNLTPRMNQKGVKFEDVKKVKYNNDHTDGYVFKLFWFNRYREDHKNKGGFKNNDMFVFKANGPVKDGLFDKIKKGEWKHFHISPSRFTLNSDHKLKKL